jgi:hypothetical protein
MSALHGDQTTAQGLHIVVKWEFVDTTARDAFVYTSADIGGIARVGAAAPYEFYVLNNNVGPAWHQIGDGAGTVTQVDTGVGLTGGPITTTGTIDLDNTTVSPGSYTVASITVDAQGRLTAASSGVAAGDVVGPASAVDNNVAAFDGVTGKLIKDSGSTVASLANERYWSDPGLVAVPAALYVDNVTGSDTTGDGSVGSPWATLGKAMLEMPILSDNPRIINLVQSATAYEFPSRTLWAFNLCSIQGELVNDGLGTLTSTAGTGGSEAAGTNIEVSGSAWVTDEHVGKLILFSSGALTGKYGVVYENDADTLFATTQDTSYVAPSSGDQFELLEFGSRIEWDPGTSSDEEAISVNRNLGFKNIKFNINTAGTDRSLQNSSISRIDYQRCYFDQDISVIVISDGARARLRTCYVTNRGDDFGERGMIQAGKNGSLSLFQGTVIDCRFATTTDPTGSGIKSKAGSTPKWQGELVIRGMGTLGYSLESCFVGKNDNAGSTNLIRFVDCQTGFIINTNSEEAGGAYGLPDLYGNITGNYVVTADDGAYVTINGGTATSVVGVLAVSADNGVSNIALTARGTRIEGGSPAPPDVFAHAASHENGGSDEVSVAGLSGLLADAQTPTSHASSHISTGSDSIAEFTGATGVADGLDGLVKKPVAGEDALFLKGDGSWAAAMTGIDVGNVIYVDAISGNDGTGAADRFDLPFLTIGAAIAVASAGDSIQVRPGTYAESGLTLPTDVTLVSVGGWKVTTVGAHAAVADIIAMANQSSIDGFTILVPDTAGLRGISYTGSGATPTASIYNCNIFGDAAVGQGDGIYNTGTGKIIGSEIRADQGGLNSVMRVDAGTIALESIHVPPGTGTIDIVALGEGTGRFQLVDLNIGSSNVTDGVWCDGTSKTLIFGINTVSLTNSLNIASDGIELRVLGGKMDQSAYAVTIDPALLGTNTVVRITANHEPVYSFPPAIINSDFGLTFFQEGGPERYSQNRTFGVDAAFGFAEKGTKTYQGEGPPYSFGINVVTSDATGVGGLTDVSAAAKSLSGSSFTFQGTATGHRIYLGTIRKTAAGTLLKHWAARIIQSTAGVGGSYRFLRWSGAAWTEFGVQSVSESESYRYADEVFLRAASTELLHYGMNTDTSWATSSVNGVTAYWVVIEIVTVVTTLPVFETFWLVPSTLQINGIGQRGAIGLSRWRQTLVAAGNVFGESGGVTAGSLPVGSGGLPTGWNQILVNSNLNSNGDAIYFQFTLPNGVCTAFPFDVTVVWGVDTGSSQPVTTAPQVTISAIPIEVAGNLIADSGGGIAPVTRTAASTETLTAKAGSSSGPANLLPNGGSVPLDYSGKLYSEPYRSLIDVSSYYEGDMIAVRFELDDDGTPNQNIVIWGLIIEGVMFADGKVL